MVEGLQRKSFFSSYTQQFTLKRITEAYERCCRKNAESKVIELGGGNSCFVDAFCCSQEPVKRYDIIDNNELAVSLFEDKMKLGNIAHRGYLFNLVNCVDESIFQEKYDFVYSVGLIEHFTPEERRRVIDAHLHW